MIFRGKQISDNIAAFHASFFLCVRVLRSKTRKNQPYAALEHLKLAKIGVWSLEPQNLVSSNGAEWGGGVNFSRNFFRGRREQKAAFPPWPMAQRDVKLGGASRETASGAS